MRLILNNYSSQKGYESVEDNIRDKTEIARRSLGVYYTWCVAIQYKDRQGILNWVDENNLRDILSKQELNFITANPPPKQQIINFSWHCERLLILLWCLNLVDAIPAADKQCNTSIFQTLLPPLTEKVFQIF